MEAEGDGNSGDSDDGLMMGGDMDDKGGSVVIGGGDS